MSDDIAADLRRARRTLAATPIVSIAAVMSLAFGIGAVTALFSLVNGLLLRPFPVSHPEALVRVLTGFQQGEDVFSFATWNEIRDLHGFAGAAAWAPPSRLRITRPGLEPEMADALWLSGEFGRVLGVPMAIGQPYTSSDDERGGGGDGLVAVISYRMWQERFGGAPVVGTSILVERTPVRIVGVTAREFIGFEVGRGFDLALPVHAQPVVRGAGGITDEPWLRIVLRLSPDRSLELATATLRAAQPSIRDRALPQTPRLRPGFLTKPFILEPFASGPSAMRTRYARPLLTVLFVAAFVLLIACANVANLMLARGTARRHEASLKVALGASRSRLARELLIETGMVALAGTAAGIAFAMWAAPLIVKQLSGGPTPVLLDVSLDWRVLGVSALLMVVAVLLSGIAPAVRFANAPPMALLRSMTVAGSRSRLSNGLVVAQIAVSLTLVVVAGLLIGTVQRLAAASLGFNSGGVLLITADAARASIAEADRTAFYYRLLDNVRALPGVTHVGGSLGTPLGTPAAAPVFVSLSGGTNSTFDGTALLNGITPGWIRTYATPLRAGRDFTDFDTALTPPVLLVNDAFVRRFLRNRTPTGVAVALAGGANAEMSLGPRRIVGVIGDVAWESARASVQPTVYIPLRQWPTPLHPTWALHISVRTATASPTMVAPSVTASLKSLDGNLQLTSRALTEQVESSFVHEHLVAKLTASFGGFGLLLAALGLYGVTSYAVRRRQAEIVLRVALGATPSQATWLIMSRVAGLITAGIMIGTALSAWSVELIAPLLYGIEPDDPATLAFAALTLAVVGIIAGWLPARRAARIAPAEALRNN